MDRSDELAQEVEALRDRLSGLSEASRRINESLDFETVLQGILGCARALTGARYAGITTVDGSGQPQEFFTTGMSPEERQWMVDFPEGPTFFKHLFGLAEPLRTGDFQSHVRSLGLPEFQSPLAVTSLLATSLRNRGEVVGTIYLIKGEGDQDFTPEDDETLIMFSSQAALIIASARRYRDEQRARADLETLINTSPVGVAVFDAGTGAPVSFNREAARILESLWMPGRPPENLLEVLTVRRADGREISLQEFPLAQLLSPGETLRAEEIVLSVPGGRSVTTLVNMTPMHSGDGEVASVVATMQDMTPLEEVERLRAEFLAMVSHELRTPLTSIKGSAATVLGVSSTLGPAEMVQFFRIIDQQADQMSVLINDLLDVARIETGTLSVNPEPVTVASLVDQARSAFLSGGGRHGIRIDLPPDLPRVVADPRRIAQVLGNLLSNAARHSPEASPIRVSAAHEDFHVAISVSDEGSGVPAERLPHLFQKFSRLNAEDQGGDTGLGLAICRGIVEAHGGRIWAESDGPGLGARLTFTIPVVEEAGTGPATTGPGRRAARSRQPDGKQVRILAVDDDPLALRYIRDSLSMAGYSPIMTGDPHEALSLMEANDPHLVLLDLMLPETDGIELMKEILDIAKVPVIFLSAYGQEDVIARAFDMGAVDYVVKPFSPTELAARIRAALRKWAASEVVEPSEPYEWRDLVIDYAERSVTVAGRPVRLTAIEYRLLVELSANAGRVLTYAHLLERVWGQGSDGDLRPMRSAVKSLRRNLGDDANNPTYIFTELRVGYRMAKAETPEPETE